MATTRGAYESFNTNGFETRLTTEASAIDTVFYLQTTQGLTSPFYMVIDPEDIGQREYVFIDGNVTSTSVEIADANQDNRYLEGSGASSGLTHTAGTTVRLAPTLQHFEDLWDAIGQVVDVDFTSANAGQVNFDATEAVADVATDKVFFKDSSDSDNLKKESIADIVTNIAGTGLTATSGVLSVDEATSLKGDIKAENDTVILDNGTDGTDATFTGDVTGDLTGNVSGDITGNITSSGTSDFSGTVDVTGASVTGLSVSSVEADTISEKTTDNGVTIDGVLLKDSEVDGVSMADVVQKDVLTGQTFILWGERNGSHAVGQHFSFGNGASDGQFKLPYACKLIAMTVQGGGTVRIYKNNASAGTDYQQAAGGVNTFTTPLDFAAGDRFHFESVSAGSVTTVVSAVGIYT